MKNHPIIFSGPSVLAILEGRKTQTRRVVKPQPVRVSGMHDLDAEPGETVIFNGWPTKLVESRGKWKRAAGELTPQAKKCPYGQPGCSILWVREAWCDIRDGGFDRDVAYRADALNRNRQEDGDSQRIREEFGYKYRPSIHMPRWACRLFLEVTEVRVERLQEITPEDAKSEGMRVKLPRRRSLTDREVFERRVVEFYREQWDSLNAKRGFGWETNPWVWVVSFNHQK